MTTKELKDLAELKHVIATQQFSTTMMEQLFTIADQMIKLAANGGTDILKDKIVATFFYEESTRTRLSFEAAAHRLGARVISTTNARQYSSVAKGETLEDTIRTIANYADAIIMRHHETGAAIRAAAFSHVPFINAGDGAGQHVTQALLDAYTIKKEIGGLDNISIAMVGDLANGRTVRSLSYLLSKYTNTIIYFVAPDLLKMKDDIKEHLKENNIKFIECSDLKKIADKVDVIYMTRIQKERFGDRINEYNQVFGSYIIDDSLMNYISPEAIIMHPLPRVNEIHPEVDNDHRAAYFRQAQNGLYIRMALLLVVFNRYEEFLK